MPYDELISKLIPILTPLGMTVEKSKNDTPVITYDKVPGIVNSFGVSSGVTSCFIFGEMTEGY